MASYKSDKVKHIISSIGQSLRSFLFSKDALIFCFFLLLAMSIWYLHGLQKLHSNSVATAKPEPVQPAPEYMERHFTVPVKSRAVPKGQEMILFPAEVTITAKVEVAHYNDIHPDDFSAVCTYQNNANTLPIEVSCSSSYIVNYTHSPQAVEYVLQNKN